MGYLEDINQVAGEALRLVRALEKGVDALEARVTVQEKMSRQSDTLMEAHRVSGKALEDINQVAGEALRLVRAQEECNRISGDALEKGLDALEARVTVQEKMSRQSDTLMEAHRVSEKALEDRLKLIEDIEPEELVERLRVAEVVEQGEAQVKLIERVKALEDDARDLRRTLLDEADTTPGASE